MKEEAKTLAQRITESNEKARLEGHAISEERWQEYLKSQGIFSATPIGNMVPHPQVDLEGKTDN